MCVPWISSFMVQHTNLKAKKIKCDSIIFEHSRHILECTRAISSPKEPARVGLSHKTKKCSYKKIILKFNKTFEET